MITVSFPESFHTDARIELVDLGGKIILTQPFTQKATMNVSSVPAGVYVVRNGNQSVKLTINK